VASNKAKIRLKLKTYREQLQHMVGVLEFIDETLHDGSATKSIYIASATGYIDKASSMLARAAQDLETKKQKGE
jgi:hypothetical protein